MNKKCKKTRTQLLQLLQEHLDAADIKRGEAEAQLGKRSGWLSDRSRYGIDIRDLTALLDIIGLHPVEFFRDALEEQGDQKFHRGHPIQTRATEIWHRGPDKEDRAIKQWLLRLEDLRYRAPETVISLILERIGEIPKRSLPLALGCAGSAFRAMLRFVEAEGFVRQALEYASELDDQAARGTLFQRLSFIYSDQAYYSKALRENDRSIEVYLSENDSSRLGRSLVDRGIFRGSQGQLHLAVNAFQIAIPLLEPSDQRNHFGALQGLIYCCTKIGALDEALALVPRAKKFKVSSVSRGKLNWSIGILYRELERNEEAVAELMSSIVIFRETGSLIDSTLASLDLCETYLQLSNLEAAHKVAIETVDFVSHLKSSAPWLAKALRRLTEIGSEGQGINSSLLGRIREKVESGRFGATEKLVDLLRADEPLNSRIIRVLSEFLRRQGTKIGDFEARIGKARGWLANRRRYSIKVTDLIQILEEARVSPIEFFQEIFEGQIESRSRSEELPLICKAATLFSKSHCTEKPKYSAKLKALDEDRYEHPENTISEISKDLFLGLVPRNSIPLALGILGSAHRVRSELSLAREYILEAIKCAREIGDSRQVGAHYQRLSFVFYDQRRLARALEINSMAIEMHLYAGSDVDLGKSLVDRGVFRGTQRKDLLANKIFRAAKKYLEGSDEMRHQLAALQGLTRTYVRLRRLEEAMECARKASSFTVDEPTAAKLRWTIGILQSRRGNYDEAIQELSKCREVLIELSPVDAALIQIDLCETCFDAGIEELAYFHAANALQLSSPILRISEAADAAICDLANYGIQKTLTLTHLKSIRVRVKEAASRSR